MCRKALPGLYREVARETGEYIDNIGNSNTAAPRRLGGAQPLSGTYIMYGEREHVLWCAL